MNAFWVQSTGFYDFFNFCNDAFCGFGHILIEISFCHFELKVSQFVCSFGLNDGEISENSSFLNILFVIEDSRRFRFRKNLILRFNFSFLHSFVISVKFKFYWESSGFDYCINSCWSEESGNTSSTGSNFFSKSALRTDLEFKLTSEVLFLELDVFSHVRRYHAFDLFRPEKDRESPIYFSIFVSKSAVVGNNGEVFSLGLFDGIDEIHGYSS